MPWPKGRPQSAEHRRRISESTRGPKHHAWQGGRYENPVTGYVEVKVPGGREYEHRLVAEQKLGRPLRPGEVVHHIDGNRANNDPDNLKVFSSNADHLRYELAAD